MLGNSKATPMFLRVETWEPGSPLEEVYIGGLQMAQGMLQCLTVDFLQPAVGLGLFHCCQLTGLLILFLALGEKMIVDKADTTKIIRSVRLKLPERAISTILVETLCNFDGLMHGRHHLQLFYSVSANKMA